MDLSVVCKGSVGNRIVSNAGLLFGAKALGAILGVITLIVTAQALDSQVEFGIVIFLHAYMIFFAEMMTFQPWQSIIRFGSDDAEAEDGPSFAKLVKFSAILDAVAVCLSYVAAIALFGVFVAIVKAYPDFWPGNQQIDPSKLFGLVVAYCSVVLFQQTGMSTGVLRLFDKFNGLAAAWLVMPSVRLIGVLIAAHQGWGMIGFIAVWYAGALIRNFVVIGLGLTELAKRGILKPAIKAKVDFLRPRSGLWAFSTKAYFDSSLAAGFSHLPVLLVMVVFGPIFVTVYKFAEEIAKLLSEGVKLLDQVIYPELARIVAAGKGGQILRLVTKASAVSLTAGVFLSALAYILAPPLVERFLGEGYEMIPSLAVLLVFGASIFAAVAPLYPVFYAVGKPERAIYSRAAGIIAYISSFILLTRWLGEIGTGWAWIVGYSVALIAVIILVLRTLSAFKEDQA
ncbi:MAG: lipopolysaccharide biosynthesis protein [Litorimonas sp.]